MANWPQVSIDTEKDLNICFACGQKNPMGLKINFDWNGKRAVAEFVPSQFHQGWVGLIHGGIITCILDEAMSYAALFEGITGLTAKIEVRFKHPVQLGQSLNISAHLTRKTKRLAEAEAEVSLKDGTVIAESTATLFLTSKKAENQKASKNKARAVIWDMDGVIVDTAAFHLKAWQEVFKKRGVKFSEADFKKSFGQRNDAIIRNALGSELAHKELVSISAAKEASFRKKIAGKIKPLPGVIKLINALKERDFKMALASSAPVQNIRLLLTTLDIYRYFRVIVSDKDVAEGKPSPQAFLLATQRLGVEPENCIVIEDAVAGVEAAKRGGMKSLAITNTHPQQKLAKADIIVDTLKKVSASDLEDLFK